MFGMTGRLEPKMKSGSGRMILEWLNLYVMSSLWDSKDGFHVLAGGFKRSSYSFIFTLEEMTQFYCIFFQMRGSATNSCSFVSNHSRLGVSSSWTGPYPVNFGEYISPKKKFGQDLCVGRFVVRWTRHIGLPQTGKMLAMISVVLDGWCG